MNNSNPDNRVPLDNPQHHRETEDRERSGQNAAPNATPQGATPESAKQGSEQLSEASEDNLQPVEAEYVRKDRLEQSRRREAKIPDSAELPWHKPDIPGAPEAPDEPQLIAPSPPVSQADFSTSNLQNNDNLLAPDRYSQSNQPSLQTPQSQQSPYSQQSEQFQHSQHSQHGPQVGTGYADAPDEDEHQSYGFPGHVSNKPVSTRSAPRPGGRRRRTGELLYKPSPPEPDYDTSGRGAAGTLSNSRPRGINPNLLPPSGPRGEQNRSGGNNGDNADLRYLFSFFFQEAKTLIMDPIGFFSSRNMDASNIEPILFMSIASGISGLLICLSGHLADGLGLIAGTFMFVVVGAFVCTTALDWLANKSTYITVFRIFGFCQAPFVLAWINLGHIPIGWYVACAYSMYLCMVGLEQTYRIDQKWSAIVVITVTVAVRLMLHFMHM